jgi:hypothetical protein
LERSQLRGLRSTITLLDQWPVTHQPRKRWELLRQCKIAVPRWYAFTMK